MTALGTGLWLALMLVMGMPTPRGAWQRGPTAPSAAAPLAVVDGDLPDVEVVLLEVKRTSGGTVNVRWQYHNKGTAKRELGFIGTNKSDHYKLAAEAYLVDQTNKKKYLVVRDSANLPVGASHDKLAL